MINELWNQHLPGSEPFIQTCDAYEASISSSAASSSSQFSVFSDVSAQSSIATSVSDDFRSSQEDLRERDRICAQSQLQYQSRTGKVQHGELNSAVAAHLQKHSGQAPPTYADVTSIPVAQRQHPRRCSVSRDRKPPQLVRQRDRKIDFVDNLVDSATQMVEVIWPLSVVPCQAEGGNGRGVLPLRTYIEETLRRSRTSYSTLQVALYYLILIMPLVPTSDFTREQISHCPASRALMCGRRMFLSALILASKYLQDRNYSAKAWSKMSGLKINEINTNERTFLEKVNWRLHIPKPTFEKWQELVLRYTPRPQGCSASSISLKWKEVVPLLTPELDRVPMPVEASKVRAPESTGFLGLLSPAATPAVTPTHDRSSSPMESCSQESTPTPATVLPRFLEPRPDMLPPTPALARMGPLPTPQMTPSSVASHTPAASACGSRRPSMCSAMVQAQRSALSRCALDAFVPSELRHALSRRSSQLSTASTGSSPESMISDRPRASRSSSISSLSSMTASSAFPPARACLARQATCRNVRLPLPASLRDVREEGTVSKPIILDDDVDMAASPDFADFSVSEKALHAPHRHSKNAPSARPLTVAADRASRKRCRSYQSHGGSSGNHGRFDVEAEISAQLRDYHDEEMEVDDHIAHDSEAVYYAQHLLHHSTGSVSSDDEKLRASSVQPYMRSDSGAKGDVVFLSPYNTSPSPLGNRVPVRNSRGNKRSCVAPHQQAHNYLYSDIA